MRICVRFVQREGCDAIMQAIFDFILTWGFRGKSVVLTVINENLLIDSASKLGKLFTVQVAEYASASNYTV